MTLLSIQIQTERQVKKTYYYIQARNNNEVEIHFYGEIFRYTDRDAKNFSYKLRELEVKYQKIHLHVHSGGGDVFEGIAIFNAIRNCKAQVIGYVDGIAASMASIIILACDKVYMYKNTLLMIHKASGGAWGNANTLQEVVDLLNKIDGVLKEHYTDKNAEVATKIEKLFDGKDHWFTAKEAFAEGLIDGIIEEQRDIPVLPDAQNMNSTALGVAIAASLQSNPPSEKTPKPNQKMEAALVQKVVNQTGINLNAEATDETVINELLAQIAGKDTQISALEASVQETQKLQLKNFLDAKQETKGITATQRAKFEDMAEKMGYEYVEEFVNELPDRKKITNQIQDNGGAGSTEDRSAWTWDDYQAKDAKALEAMQKDAPEQFKALFDAKYKK